MSRVREGKLGCKIRPVYYRGQCKHADHAGKRAGIFVSVKTTIDSYSSSHTGCITLSTKHKAGFLDAFTDWLQEEATKIDHSQSLLHCSVLQVSC